VGGRNEPDALSHQVVEVLRFVTRYGVKRMDLYRQIDELRAYRVGLRRNIAVIFGPMSPVSDLTRAAVSKICVWNCAGRALPPLSCHGHPHSPDTRLGRLSPFPQGSSPLSSPRLPDSSPRNGGGSGSARPEYSKKSNGAILRLQDDRGRARPPLDLVGPQAATVRNA
jgi:hypothetical protein